MEQLDINSDDDCRCWLSMIESIMEEDQNIKQNFSELIDQEFKAQVLDAFEYPEDIDLVYIARKYVQVSMMEESFISRVLNKILFYIINVKHGL